MQEPEPKSDYEMERQKRMEDNTRALMLLDRLKIGKVVHIPHSVFPDEPVPPEGYWVGKLCKTNKGGMGDIGIHIEGEEIFTRPRLEVTGWLQEEEEPPEPPPSEFAPAAATPEVSCARAGSKPLAHAPALPRQPLPFLPPVSPVRLPGVMPGAISLPAARPCGYAQAIAV